MEEKYKAALCFTDSFPWFLRSSSSLLGAGNMYEGIITFDQNSLLLNQTRKMGWSIQKNNLRNLTVAYKDITSYSRSLRDIYLLHDNPDLPKIIMIEGGDVDNIQSSLEKRGISRSEDDKSNWKSANRTLLFAIVFAVLLLIILEVIHTVSKK